MLASAPFQQTKPDTVCAVVLQAASEQEVAVPVVPPQSCDDRRIGRIERSRPVAHSRAHPDLPLGHGATEAGGTAREPGI